jgi:hypothetical protein
MRYPLSQALGVDTISWHITHVGLLAKRPKNDTWFFPSPSSSGLIQHLIPRHDDESVTLETSFPMIREGVTCNDGRVSAMYLNEIRLFKMSLI